MAEKTGKSRVTWKHKAIGIIVMLAGLLLFGYMVEKAGPSEIIAGIRRLVSLREDELFVAAKELAAPLELVRGIARDGKLPVVNFVAGGIATPADAALAMQLGAEGVFVGSGIFKSEDPARTANAIVQATTHFDDPKVIAEVSKALGAPMRGIALEAIPEAERLAVRGW